MALNPILNVYILNLNPRDKKANLTFRDLFKSKYAAQDCASDNSLFPLLFTDFLNKVGKSDFRKDVKTKKVLGVSEYDEERNLSSLSLHTESNVIEGIIDAGHYGLLRAYADVNNKAEKQALGPSKAVLDKFYICLSTPLNSDTGFLLVQSYTEARIQDTIDNFIYDLFDFGEEYYSIVITPFVPKRFVNQYHETAKVRLFKYGTKLPISRVLRDKKEIIKGQAVEVQVLIKPLEQDFLPETEELIAVVNQIGEKIVDNIKLCDCSKKTVYLTEKNGRNAHYDIGKEMSSIRPTIYLIDEGIEIDENGQPNFIQIKSFVSSLLVEVQNEYNNENEIDEL